MRRYRRLITIMVLIFFTVTFLGADYALAQKIEVNSPNFGADGDSGQIPKIGIIGGIVLVGIIIFAQHKEKQYKEHMQTGRRQLEAGNYRQAVKNLEEARDNKDTPEVNELFGEAVDGLQRVSYQNGIEYLEAKEWRRAYDEFRRIIKYGNYKDSRRRINQAYQKLREEKLKRVTFMKFEDTSFRYDLDEVVPDMVVSELAAKNPRFIELVDRDQMSMILQEQKLQASGLIDSSTANELGNIKGVDVIVSGSVQNVNVDYTKDKSEQIFSDKENEYTYEQEKVAEADITVKIVEVSTGEIVGSKTCEGDYRWVASSGLGSILSDADESETLSDGFTSNIPSDEKLVKEALQEATKSIAEYIYNQYELVPHPNEL